MRKLRAVWLALAAVFSLAAVFASTASAENTLLAEWLNNGSAIPNGTSLEAEAAGELLLEDTSNKGSVQCTGIFDIIVYPGGRIEFVLVLLLNKSASVTLTARLLCKATAGSACEENATDIEVAPEKLPWSSLLFLDETTGKYLQAVWNAGYSVTCLVVIKITDECEEELGTQEVKNVTGGVEAVGSVSPLSHCSIGGNGTGLIEPLSGNLVTLNSPNGPLTVSSGP